MNQSVKMTKSYASFEVLIESGAEDTDEAKEEALEWIKEHAGEMSEKNVKVVQLPSLEDDDYRTFKIGDRVTGIVDNKQEVGTVVSLLLIGPNGPQAFVRFDTGALRGLTLDELALLD